MSFASSVGSKADLQLLKNEGQVGTCDAVCGPVEREFDGQWTYLE
jgi:hypothetical protein